MTTVTTRLKQAATDQGFSLVGVCAAVPTPGFDRFQQWLDAGFAGEMRYLEQRRHAYSHPHHVLEDARSLVMLGWNYRTTEPSPAADGHGKISRYAWSDIDYHDWLRNKLNVLAELLRGWVPGCQVRGVVDTAPLLEREFAQLAGLGWIGKNTLLLNRQAGSWFFLAALLTNVELDSDPSWQTDHCGSCRACLDACPTQAFPRPYVLDASKCVSYLTIELRDAVPQTLRAGLQDWLFGCDVCQDVCPWNRRAPVALGQEFEPVPGHDPVDLIALLSLDEAAFRARFRKTPLWRAKRRGIMRNAAYVLGNQRCLAAESALLATLVDEEPLVRGASAWALGRLASPLAGEALRRRLEDEPLPEVRAEIHSALESLLS